MNKSNINLLEDLAAEIYNSFLELNDIYDLKNLKIYLNETSKLIPANTNLFRIVDEILNRDLKNVAANMIQGVRDFCIEKLECVLEDGIVEYHNDKNYIIKVIRQKINLKDVDNQLKKYMD